MTLYPSWPAARRASAPAARAPLPQQRVFPSGRYVKTNPLRRLFGLQLLGEALPDALRMSLIRAWMYPRRFDGNQAIQSAYRERPAEARLFGLAPGWLGLIAHIELEVSRRVVETPRTQITRETRNRLLRSQGAYLGCLYVALAAQVGEAAARAEFELLTLRVQ